VPEEVTRNATVQLSTPYTERHKALRYKQTDGQTDDSIMTIADQTA